MYRGDRIRADDKEEFYCQLLQHADSLLTEEQNWIANLANISSLLYYQLEDVNWAGFYLYDGKELVVGPFQGKPACTRIGIGDGVCGTAAETRETQLVDDVQEFPGHIACDPASRSEIVVPMIEDDSLLGVLDIDSPICSRFDEQDSTYLGRLVDMVIHSSG